MNTFTTATRIIHFIGLSIFCAVASGCKDGPLSTKERDAAKAVLKELNKLGSYTEAGINYQEYQTRVLDAKGEIDNHLLDIPSGPIKDTLKASLNGYVDAREFWGLAVTQSCFYLETEQRQRFSKYGDDFDKTVFVEHSVEELGRTVARLVNVLWQYAGVQATLAERLLSQ